MKQLKILTLTIMMLGLAAVANAAGKIKVIQAWIPQAPPVAGVMAGYFKVENNTDKPINLVSASSPAFANVMMHKSIEKDGMSRMIHIDKLKVPAHGSVTFKRGSYHLMLMRPKHSFKVGDKVAITLMTSQKHKIHFTAVVKPATAGE